MLSFENFDNLKIQNVNPYTGESIDFKHKIYTGISQPEKKTKTKQNTNGKSSPRTVCSNFC